MAIHLKLYRDTFTTESSVGKLYNGDEFLCHTLEDVSRGENVKIMAKTAIPTGIYKMQVSMSNRFKRDMIMIFTEDNGYELVNKGISFKGIRIHGGNDHEDSEG